MKKFYLALFASFLLLAFSVPAWANGSSKNKQPYLSKNDTHYGQYHFKHNKFDKQKLKVLKQFRELKATYNKTVEDARQMFLEFLGSAVPTAGCDVQAVRDEYEQQIAQLNATIASQQAQISQANQTISSLQQQIGDMNATIASKQAEIDTLKTTQQSAIDTALAAQKDELTQQCDEQKATAYENGRVDGLATCPTTGPAGEPQQLNSWSTDTLYPYALDVDGSGNTFVLDRDVDTIGVYDSTGTLATQWTPATLSTPIDLAVDSHGDVYVLDSSAAAALQKFSPTGQPLTTFSPSVNPSNPTGLFIDNNDTIYVTDSAGGAYGSRILMYDISGTFKGTLGEVPELSYEEYMDVAVDETNQIVYVVTRFNLVAKLAMNGSFLGSWGDGSNLRFPNSIAIGAQGQVFVADTYNDEIDQYDTDGNLIYNIGSNDLYRPSRIVVDGAGKLYVADESNLTIRVYQ